MKTSNDRAWQGVAFIIFTIVVYLSLPVGIVVVDVLKHYGKL